MAVTNSSPTPPTRLLPYRGSNAACHCILSAHVCTRNLTKFAFHCNFWRLSAAKRLTCRFSLETSPGAKLFQYCAHVCSGMTMSDLFWGPPAKTEHQNQLGICLPQRMPTTEIVENQTPERCSWDCRSSNHVIPNPQSSPRNASASEVSSLEAFATGQLAELAASRVPFELARALQHPQSMQLKQLMQPTQWDSLWLRTIKLIKGLKGGRTVNLALYKSFSSCDEKLLCDKMEGGTSIGLGWHQMVVTLLLAAPSCWAVWKDRIENIWQKQLPKLLFIPVLH